MLMKKGGVALAAHMKTVIEKAKVTEDPTQHPEERGKMFNFYFSSK